MELCKACAVQLTDADWEAGRCTECGDGPFVEHLGPQEFVEWDGEHFTIGQFTDGIGTETVTLTKAMVCKLAKFARC